MTGKIVVLSTCASREEAERIGSSLVDRQLAACVTILPGATSIYRWQGKVEKATEWVLVIKTRKDLFESLALELKTMHSYEVPELIAFTIVDGSEAYLNWIESETAPRPPR